MTCSCSPGATHHLACNCREKKVVALGNAAADCASEIDALQASSSWLTPEQHARLRAIVERTYDAAEAAGITIGATENTEEA